MDYSAVVRWDNENRNAKATEILLIIDMLIGRDEDVEQCIARLMSAPFLVPAQPIRGTVVSSSN